MSMMSAPVDAPVWPQYGRAVHVGTSANGKVSVYFDPQLGRPGLQNACDLLTDADRVVAANDRIFGIVSGAVNVIVFALGGRTDGTGGADHMACDFVNGGSIEVCAAFGAPARVSALFEAELSECSMGGRLCEVSTGEALSRWCAAVVSDNALGDFATAPIWQAAGAPDFVNITDPTDRNPISTGCGMAFLSWLLSLGHSLNEAARAMVTLGDTGTLAQLYAELTGNPATAAWDTFCTAVHALPTKITTDDPFTALPMPAQLALHNPGTAEPVDAALRPAPDPVCQIRSHRLLAADLDYPDDLTTQL
ncbi:hypothetical protein GPX89_39135 [Nocardia sp. ET3-3]|uniref:Uncharacterized protein n=1 Tax=Nocardia terrae TaxID=2675851 RepID=A0A7K1V9D8_9NOCA|nr:hypothetical protein [Nocardia terrae]MVU83240.1 hypothetical protein [Nocardia terrae]